MSAQFVQNVPVKTNQPNRREVLLSAVAAVASNTLPVNFLSLLAAGKEIAPALQASSDFDLAVTHLIFSSPIILETKMNLHAALAKLANPEFTRELLFDPVMAHMKVAGIFSQVVCEHPTFEKLNRLFAPRSRESIRETHAIFREIKQLCENEQEFANEILTELKRRNIDLEQLWRANVPKTAIAEKGSAEAWKIRQSYSTHGIDVDLRPIDGADKALQFISKYLNHYSNGTLQQWYNRERPSLAPYQRVERKLVGLDYKPAVLTPERNRQLALDSLAHWLKHEEVLIESNFGLPASYLSIIHGPGAILEWTKELIDDGFPRDEPQNSLLRCSKFRAGNGYRRSGYHLVVEDAPVELIRVIERAKRAKGDL